MIWTLPNILTIGRVLAAPLIVALMFVPNEAVRWIVVALFALAAVTDYFDGWLARARGQTSAFGRFLDPIADKVLVVGVLIMLVADGTLRGVHVVPVILIIGREILVSGLREFLAADSIAVPVTFLAKCKTALQLSAIVVLMAVAVTGEIVLVIGLVLLWAAAVATVITGADYMTRGLRHIISTDSKSGGS